MKTSTGEYFTTDTPSAPWGDYGHILTHGMSRRAEGGTVLVERTGPYVPPLSQPFGECAILTADFAALLEASGLTGFTIKPAKKSHIVRVPWQEWDLKADGPAFYPEGGEPENYILEQPHCDETAARMPDLFSVEVSKIARVYRKKIAGQSRDQLYLDTDTTDGLDFVQSESTGYTYVSPRARDWLSEHASDWVVFDNCRTLRSREIGEASMRELRS